MIPPKPKPKPLNSVQPESEYKLGKMTPEQQQELTEWLLGLCLDPTYMEAPPQFYRPVIAYINMKSSDVAPEGMYPWNMPNDLVEFYADLWLVNRITSMKAAQQEQDKPSHRHTSGSGSTPFVDMYRFDPRGGTS